MTMLPVPVSLRSIDVAGGSARWADLGFSVSPGDAIAVGNGALAFDGTDSPPRLLGLTVDGLPGSMNTAEVNGVTVSVGEPVDPVDHPNGAIEFDHVVIATPDLARTSRAVAAVLGMRQLRVREQQRQAFHRFADIDDSNAGVTRGCILELVERDELDRAALWGVVVTVRDLDAVADRAGVGPARSAVQDGRRIAVVGPDAGLGIAVAFMSPHVSASDC